MRIGEISKKYGVTRREVDYWTNLGLLHSDDVDEDPVVELSNSYRNYGSKAEEELKKLIILKAMGAKIDEEHVEFLDSVPRDMYDICVIQAIKDERDRVMKQFTMALDFAGECMERA